MEMAKYRLKICWVEHLQPTTWAELLSFNLFLCSSLPSPVFDFSASAIKHHTRGDTCQATPDFLLLIPSLEPPAWVEHLFHTATSLGMIYKGKSYSEKQVGGPQEKKKKKRLSLPITALSPSSFAIDRVRWTYLSLLPTTTISVALLSGSSLTKWQNPVLPISDFISLIVPLPKVLSISSFSQWRALCHFVSHLIWIPPSMCGRWITE